MKFNSSKNLSRKEYVVEKIGNFKLKLQLKAQSPMIHFQHGSPGITLRATEVKPKLDRYLVKQMEKKNMVIPKNWKLKVEGKDTIAFNYKMTITSEAPVESAKPYRIYYGDLKDYEDTMIWTNPEISIFCRNIELLEFIKDHIENFFYVTNFGTMQNKGFGGFIPEDKFTTESLSEENIRQLADVFAKEAESDIYYITFPQRANKPRESYYEYFFKQIALFHGVMKSGRNNRDKGYIRSFLFRYMHNQNIDNEKAYMKERGLAPKGNKGTIQVNKNPKFVRSLLGLAGNYSFRGDKRININVDHLHKKIERMPSPIFYKIIKNVLFIYGRPLPQAIYDQKFEFKSGGKKIELFTPAENEFDLKDFMDQYVNYYNQDAKRNLKSETIMEVKKI